MSQQPAIDHPNWAKEMGLSWSKKWHYLRPDSPLSSFGDSATTLCGHQAFVRVALPQHLREAIAAGEDIDTCRRCTRLKELAQT